MIHYYTSWPCNLQCSWGNKPTPPGTSSTPLPPPAVPFPGFSPTDIMAYERQLALSKIGHDQALMHAQGQLALKQAMEMGMGIGMGGDANQTYYDGSAYQNLGPSQIYYQ